MGELFTVYGATNGTSTTGTFSVTGDIIAGSVSYITIPYGMKAKIWGKRIAGAPVTVTVNYTKNVSASSPSWVAVDTEVLPSQGELDLEMDARPVILRSDLGTEAFQFTWSQSTAGTSYVAFEIEFTEDG